MAADADRGEILVSLDLDRPEIAGRLRVDDGEEQTFVSWLGLLSALSSAAEGLRDPAASRVDRDQR